MQRHLARKHPRRQMSEPPGEVPPGWEKEAEQSHDEPSLLDLFTGKHYNRPSTGTKKNVQRTIKCPWPGIAHSNADTLLPTEFTSACEFLFSRAYDLRRHLLAEHGFEVEQEVLDALELRTTG
jgi:general transcription factor IIIA